MEYSKSVSQCTYTSHSLQGVVLMYSLPLYSAYVMSASQQA